MTIRPAEPRDVEAIFRIIRDTPSLPQWERDALAVPTSVSGDHRLQREAVVAEVEGRVTGFAQYSLLFDEAELESMAVCRSARLRGIGWALLTEVLERTRLRAAACLRLEVRAGNEAALALYRMAGFQTVGVRRAYYRAPMEDAVVMQRSWPGEPEPKDEALRYD